MGLRKHHYKASGGDGIPVELFQILKDDAVKVLHSICQEIWKTQQWPQDWKRSVFMPVPKKGNAKECSIYFTTALISHTSKVMPKILQARLQQYVKHEFPDVQAGFRKGRGTRDQIAIIRWIIEKVREFQKNIYFCFIDYAKAFDCVDHNKLWKILQEMGTPDHLTCLLRNLYAGQEATVELYKKYHQNPDNHDDVITHLEPDILECEVKSALGRITMNKASGADGIPVELFQILKDVAEKVLHSICQQIWKIQQ